MKNRFKKMLMFFLHYFNVKKEKSIVFNSFSGRQYSDSPRALSEYIHDNYPGIRIIWLANSKVKEILPSYAYAVKPGTFSAFKALATADAWVFNTGYYSNSGIWKPKSVYYVQTWHGDRGLKCVGRLAANNMGSKYKRNSLVPCSSDINLFLAGSTYGEIKAKESFNYYGEILTKGLPRNDKLLSIEKENRLIEEIKNNINIDKNKRVLLYAPTFRDNSSSSFLIDLESSYLSINDTKSDWIILLRSHVASHEVLAIKDNLNIIDVSSYPDMADLLLISDCLITDYSSCAGDFILTKKPVILAQFDIESYTEESRTLRFNPQDAGYLIAHNQQELDTILKNIDNIDHKSICSRILDFYGTQETGMATSLVTKYIIKNIEK